MASERPGWRAGLYRLLDPRARKQPGLSWLNRLIVVLIVLAATLAVIDTETAISNAHRAFFATADLVFALLFLLEYVARLWVAKENPHYAGKRWPALRYALSPAAIIDLLAILPTLLAWAGGGFVVLRLVRVMRLVRLAKLGRFSRAWLYISEAVWSRRTELQLTLAFGLSAMLLSATALYWAEGQVQPDKFGSIPRALWWSVVTLTTVGYGDVYPETVVGKFVAAVVAIIAIGLIALPTGILAAAFSEAVQRHKDDER
ncbi:ion transporter [Sandaracinobacteroides saxicola]|uniref:Ion transporter n=1 Tax=Sandaracinobacteroides saxicola TaxID=2759707 RepID=A0A7G5IJ95_9SPHN|nr:ion transporter [Sandaracinobacteroides saxicola]QMW23437.1 ion transporter [Sandaracinobacteroides saxicola]